MTDRDKQPFAAIMGGMAEVYGRDISKQALALHFRVLEAFSVEQVQEAAVAILSSRKYTSMPTPADFLEHLGGGSVEDRAEVEAGKVLQAVREHGGYNSVVFDDPVTQAVIQNAFGGWVKLCEDCGVEDSEKWFRKEFSKSWASYQRQGVRRYGVLAGRAEVANTAAGQHNWIDPPRLIGSPESAARVLAGGESREELGRGINMAMPEGLADALRA